MELSSYFRINAQGTGQFERTLMIAEEGSEVSYLEGCTAPQRDENQLHAAVVELIAHDDAYIKYSTVQNWYPGDENGVGGIYNFVTKRGLAAGKRSRIAWTQIETGSAITWKYPSCILRGDNSSGEFYSIAVSNHRQQADTGTKMIHIGKNTTSRIVSKGISAGRAHNSYRGLVRIKRRGRRGAKPYAVRLFADRQRGPGATTPSPMSILPAAMPWWSTRPPPPASRKSGCFTASSAALILKRPPRSSSAASARRCSKSCPWNSPWRPRPCSQFR